MSTSTKQTPGTGIVRGFLGEKRAASHRIATYRMTGIMRIGAIANSMNRADFGPLRLWQVHVGSRAEVAREDRDVRLSASTFAEAVALADEIRSRGEAFHRLDRMMPSRLRPRVPRIQGRSGNGVTALGSVVDEIHTWERNHNHA